MLRCGFLQQDSGAFTSLKFGCRNLLAIDWSSSCSSSISSLRGCSLFFYVTQVIVIDHTSYVVFKAYSWLLFTQSCKVGPFKTKTPCIHNSTIWPFTYITDLVKSLTRIGPRRTPVALFITITGTLCTLRKGQYHELWFFSVLLQMILVPGATQWTVITYQSNMLLPKFLACEFPVSCDLQLPKESATNAYRFDIGEAGLGSKECDDRLDNAWVTWMELVYLVHF